VEFAGVGFVDTLFRGGAFTLPVPFIPGIEVTGRVRAVGPGVAGFTPGQPVGALLNDFGRAARAGGYGEIAVAHVSMTVALPGTADLALMAGVLVNGVTAWMALHDLARLMASDDVLALGASGGLGGISCRLAAVHPARGVIGVVGSEARRAAGPAECTDVVIAADVDGEGLGSPPSRSWRPSRPTIAPAAPAARPGGRTSGRASVQSQVWNAASRRKRQVSNSVIVSEPYWLLADG
jgi:NADPH:quinone reductase